jgi:hypothetical protein
MKTIFFIPQTLTLTLAGLLLLLTASCGSIKIAPTMTLMEYTVTPTAETLKRTRKTIKINTKNTLDLYETTIRPQSLRILTITMTII